jgi:hypothetical protein
MLKKRAQIKVNSQLFVATGDYKDTLKNSYESTQKTFLKGIDEPEAEDEMPCSVEEPPQLLSVDSERSEVFLRSASYIKQSPELSDKPEAAYDGIPLFDLKLLNCAISHGKVKHPSRISNRKKKVPMLEKPSLNHYLRAILAGSQPRIKVTRNGSGRRLESD